MKNILTLALALCISGLVFGQDGHEGHNHAAESATIEQPTFLEFEKVVHDFGKVTTTEDAVYEFKFVNASGKTLLLNPPKSSCGCTTPFYPKEPMDIGAEDAITVKYSTKNRIGPINKQVRVYAQGYDTPIILTIKGEVVSPDLVQTAPTKKKNSLFK